MAETLETTVHEPVLSNEVLEALAPAFPVPGEGVYLDLNLGQGGHAALVAERFRPAAIVGIDTDPDAVAVATRRLEGAAPKVVIATAWSDELGRVLDGAGVGEVDGALFDLGLRSGQIEASGRGFSFRADEPLEMTMRPGDEPTAADLVNNLPEDELAELIGTLGEERLAGRISRAIGERRAVRPFTRSAELAQTIEIAVPAWYRAGRLHPATRTFQALRIAVNAELSRLDRALDAVIARLAPGGRVLAISFHSLEDRAVKRRFAAAAAAGEGNLLAKKPIVATAAETAKNPRARSAKLRGLEKI